MNTGLKLMKCIQYSILALCTASAAFAQNPASGIPDGGRWVVGGTFALSNIGNNELRGAKSYSGAEKEGNRVATFLPGMTIIYNLEPSNAPGRSDYLQGTTHHGIPVTVLKRDLSVGTFSDRDTSDVVTHSTYLGCRDLACTSKAEVGIGWSFQIKKADVEKLVLYNPQSELEIVHTNEKFNWFEARGYTTQVKDRIHPRLTIHDGYASDVSTGCGLLRDISPDIVVPIKEYEKGPSKWEINSLSWSLKAIEIFDLGEVTLNEEGTAYVGTLASAIGIGTESEDGPVSLDFTVIAYRDSDWGEKDFYKFGGLAQTITCKRENPNFGKVLPRYVENAYLHFDTNTVGPVPQNFPIKSFELPDQFNGGKQYQEELRTYLPRAFYYSVNNPRQYQELFESIVETTKILYPSAIANVIARLNASCSQNSRQDCAAIVGQAIKSANN
ncbi:MAG: hypothetical protein ABJH45_06170 [Paracoccaceae bacterium]